MQTNLTFEIFFSDLKKAVRKIYLLLFLLMTACLGCEWKLQNVADQHDGQAIAIERYDLLEHRYITTGDIAALQQMNTEYPTETRMLIENMLQLGPVDDPQLKSKLLLFFQDSTLRQLTNDVQKEFADMSDVEKQLSEAFLRLQKLLPSIEFPRVYTQISSLDQSIVAGDGFLGISLDKYLGSDYSLYVHYGYSERQRSMMTRSFIVPDCIGFFLLSHYPLSESDTTRAAREQHMGRIQYVVNQVAGRRVFDNEPVRQAEQILSAHRPASMEDFLKQTN